LPEVNAVVADDFISDGRAIHAVRWWGSYFDPRYAPESDPQPPFILDGWLISFHHETPDHPGPPDALLDPPPTVLGVYYAPPSAVQIAPLGILDCLDHMVCEYRVSLDQCCLLCQEVDPRNGEVPALPDVFDETAPLHYWLDIEAVVGARWSPPFPCQPEFTGHLPSDQTPDGQPWGWHTSAASVEPAGPLDASFVGRVVDFAVPPPQCWLYGSWVPQPWLCPDMPPDPHVDMAFELYARFCLWDVDGDGKVDPFDSNRVQAKFGCSVGSGDPVCDRCDIDGDGKVDPFDDNAVKAHFGPCP
jgi:hypothetical protein